MPVIYPTIIRNSVDLASRVYLNESVSWNVGFALTMDPLSTSISACLGVEALVLLSLDPNLCHLAAWTHRRWASLQ